MQYHLGVARKEGITEEENGATQSTIMAVAAGRVNAQLRDARNRNPSSAPWPLAKGIISLIFEEVSGEGRERDNHGISFLGANLLPA